MVALRCWPPFQDDRSSQDLSFGNDVLKLQGHRSDLPLSHFQKKSSLVYQCGEARTHGGIYAPSSPKLPLSVPLLYFQNRSRDNQMPHAFQSAAGSDNLPNGYFSSVICSKKLNLGLGRSTIVGGITNIDYFGELSKALQFSLSKSFKFQP